MKSRAIISRWLPLLLPALACAARPSAPPPKQALSYECDCTVFGDGEPVQSAACLHREGSAYRMRPEVLGSLTLPADARSFDAVSSCGAFHVRRDGLAMPTQLFDNGADYFCNGLSRYVLDGKYGYMDGALQVVVPPSYDFAYPFAAGRGAVCTRCTFSKADEHSEVQCARCGAVDAKGALVVPMLPADEFFAKYPSMGCEQADGL